MLVATISTLVVFGVVGWIIVNAPGWPAAQQTFFDSERFDEALPRVFVGLLVNIAIFLVAAFFILIWALVLAILRSLDDAVFFPFKLFAIVYIDLFRGLPSILIIYVLGFGLPALRIPGLTNDVFVWGIVALVLVWSAYVAEVYRAGIESVHPSQLAGARSLGLSQWQSMRFVVLPQAVRRVIPPLLNDFIGLQKDTALVGLLGLVEVARAAENYASTTFNFTGYTMAALLFIAVTIPLARATDWLIERDRRRMRASGG